MMILAPSMLSADFKVLGEDLKTTEENGAKYIHYDVMDGMFVPNITLGAPVISCLQGKTSLPFDVHLMIEEPVRYIDDFAKAGADIITFHIEAAKDVNATITKIKEAGCKPAVSVKPGTPAEAVYPYLDDVYMVLVMTVEPGFGGQSFMPDMMPKLKAIRDEANKRNLDLRIQVDGGIDGNTITQVLENGADVIVAGSYVFKASDRSEPIKTLRKKEQK